MKNVIWIVIAFALALVNGDVPLFLTMMKWGFYVGLVLLAISAVLGMLSLPFRRR